MKKGRFKNNDETTASLAWSTCSSAGVSPEIEKSYKYSWFWQLILEGCLVFMIYIIYECFDEKPLKPRVLLFDYWWMNKKHF